MSDIQRWSFPSGAGDFVRYADHVEALRQAEINAVDGILEQRAYAAGRRDGYDQGIEQGQRDAVSLALRYLQTHTAKDTLAYLEEGGM
jgi:flagellar biosynthesis/type III secretory pathway protein FliH